MGKADVIDLNLSDIRKKRIRINEDDDKVLELNTSDMNIIVRLKEALPKLRELAVNAANFSDTDTETEEGLDALAKELKETDDKMRELVDYIFDSNVSEMCAGNGSMYDPFNGKFRFEYILEALTSLYESNISGEYSKMSARLATHTAKYTN